MSKPCPSCEILSRILKSSICNQLAKGNLEKAKTCLLLAERFEKGLISFEKLLSELTALYGISKNQLQELARKSLK